MTLGDVIQALAISMATAPFFGIGRWLSWQSRKAGTCLERLRMWRHGPLIGFIVEMVALVSNLWMTLLLANLGWLSIITLWVSIYLGSLLARRLEVHFFATEAELRGVVGYVRMHGQFPPAVVFEIIEAGIPPWWLNKMPRKWQARFWQSVANLLHEERGSGAAPVEANPVNREGCKSEGSTKIKTWIDLPRGTCLTSAPIKKSSVAAIIRGVK